MSQPNPEYDSNSERTVSIPLSQVEDQVDALHLVVGEVLTEVDQDGNTVEFTLQQTGEE